MTKSDGEEKLKRGSMRKLYSERKKEEDEGFNDGVRKLSFPYKINSDCKWFKGEIIACSYVERLLSVLSWLLSTEVIHLYLSVSLFLSLESPVGNFCSFLLCLCSFQCLYFFSLKLHWHWFFPGTVYKSSLGFTRLICLNACSILPPMESI